VIQLNDVSKVYTMGKVTVNALGPVSLHIGKGEFVAVLGPSGSGKSTMMNILGCLDQPTAGEYLLDSAPVHRLSRTRLAQVRNRKIGFVFQSFNLLSRTTALENVELPLLYRGEDRRTRYERGMAALDKVGLKPWWDHTPAELSGGQQQRVAIARAIVTSPDVLLADEPTGNLDTERSFEIMELLTDLNRSGITVLMVTHEPDMAAYARTIVHFRDGLVERVENTGKAGV